MPFSADKERIIVADGRADRQAVNILMPKTVETMIGTSGLTKKTSELIKKTSELMRETAEMIIRRLEMVGGFNLAGELNILMP
jgi:5S rRNA maturation endonuclease (ribonuclease M5)